MQHDRTKKNPDKQSKQPLEVFETMRAMSRGEYSGIPAFDEKANDPKYTQAYERLRKHLDQIGSGFPKPTDLKERKQTYRYMDSGLEELDAMPDDAEIHFLKTYFLPEHADLALHVPVDRFATTSEIASNAGIEEADALKSLLSMANRACIFHKQEGNKDYFRHVSPFPGSITFSVKRLSMEFWTEGIEGYMTGFLRPVMYDFHHPTWRFIPINEKVVDGEKVLPYDNAERILLEADRVAVTSCICRAPNPNKCKLADEPYEVCLQIDEFADFYVNDLQISRYIDHDEIKKILQYNKDHHLAMCVAGSERAEIMCSCCDCCCGPFQYYKRFGFGGPSVKNITNYYLKIDKEKCNHCGDCVKYCFSPGALLMKEGKLFYDDKKCVGCGVCVPACPEKALILCLKEDIYKPPTTVFDLYMTQAEERKNTFKNK